MNCLICHEDMVSNLTIRNIFWGELGDQTNLCKTCVEKFQTIEGQSLCEGCSTLSYTKYCEDCQNWKINYPNYNFKHEALFFYNNEMKEWFRNFKFLGHYKLAKTFRKEISQYARKKTYDLLIPIPLSETREKERGFNQTEVCLSEANLTYVCLLQKKDDIEAIRQSKKSKIGRLNSKQCFYINPAINKKTKIKGKRILLFYDVYTSGRTIFHAADCLLPEKPKSIHSFSIAR